MLGLGFTLGLTLGFRVSGLAWGLGYTLVLVTLNGETLFEVEWDNFDRGLPQGGEPNRCLEKTNAQLNDSFSALQTMKMNMVKSEQNCVRWARIMKRVKKPSIRSALTNHLLARSSSSSIR